MIIKFGGEIRMGVRNLRSSEVGVWSEQNEDEDYLMSTLRYRTLGLSLWSLGLGLQAR